jgi:hypothetical protein
MAKDETKQNRTKQNRTKQNKLKRTNKKKLSSTHCQSEDQLNLTTKSNN